MGKIEVSRQKEKNMREVEVLFLSFTWSVGMIKKHKRCKGNAYLSQGMYTLQIVVLVLSSHC